MAGQDSEMILKESPVGSTMVLLAQGNINSSNAGVFSDKMTGLLNSGYEHLILDLSELLFMTSAGFRALLVTGKTADELKRTFVLCGVNDKIQQLFELGGFADLFTIYANQDTALGNVNLSTS